MQLSTILLECLDSFSRYNNTFLIKTLLNNEFFQVRLAGSHLLDTLVADPFAAEEPHPSQPVKSLQLQFEPVQTDLLLEALSLGANLERFQFWAVVTHQL